ncbi:hypothetical protein CBS101457_005585 [Exobasidium rhododendri]|nr:hypothetical protein CBS101457_005585 [Exobasidium rhododendri]
MADLKSHSDEKNLETNYKTSDTDSDVALPDIDLNHNVEGKIRNPLSGISRAHLFANVEAFAMEKNLTEHTDLLKRGALLAQDPVNYATMDDLREDEKAAIQHENAHKWSHPFTLYATIVTCSIGAATQGWDQTGSNGANLSFPTEFGIENEPWLEGIVNAAPYLASAGLGCWLSDPINNLVGRRGCIFITALILIATPIASGFTHSWGALLAVRLVLGVGMGAKGSTVPIFAAENSPASIRGALVMSWQLWTAFGIFAGFCANLAVADTGKIAWRLQLGSAFIPALPLAFGIFFCPESPRWLMKKNRYPKAFRSLLRLRHHEIQAARDLYFVHVMLEEERKIIKPTNYFMRFAELFTIPRVRRATIASGVVMLAQQMCGINIIAFYSSTIFVRSGFTERQALKASLGFGAINFLFAFPAVFTIDTFGRRSLLLFTFPNMAWSLLVAGCGTLIDRNAPVGTLTPARLGVVATFIYIFAMFYSPGEGPVPFTYSAEVFPLAQREQGMGWAVTVCLGFAALLSITLFKMLDVFQPWGTFFFYAGLNVLAACLIAMFCPETKAYTLEELDYVFSVPHKTFIDHQFRKELPYFFQHTILRRNVPRPEPLIKFEKALPRISAKTAEQAA